ncbi:RecA-superfamily ATPase possibly involved in signal transduction [Candidatus Methanoperedens nitroreducens]|uniref:RecA-superfamily ATPase possibly involved in signal transduction n=1 Tax=Candidatus Methanoperedens nitratireducens TaxID=1392998 RepID=A0A062VEN8_9EURY|nr:ATPase domain-containing protein [Candidatus Methanoperedens nitroreducens]KCZ73660.1 RecA-superfamily ATPase possibly involved in signal transduction [Candidatus Methanoperedens nitroreducens]MDJ1422381.1 ATPase domain-containing protein [Candidatus Methanoperedens sp.]
MGTVRTAIPGLDELIEGGYIENDIILVTGGPGAGKTTLGIQYLVGGATNFNEPGVLVVMDGTPERIIRDSWRFGWDIEKLISQKKIKIIYANPFKYTKFTKTPEDRTPCVIVASKNIADTLRQIQIEVEEIQAKRLFIDSITSLKLAVDRTDVRQIVSELIKNLEYLDCTTLMTSEMHSAQSFSIEEYLSSGVIRLHIFRAGGCRLRAIEILKMRGVKHDESLHPYEIQERGIVVHSTETVMNDKISLFDNMGW